MWRRFNQTCELMRKNNLPARKTVRLTARSDPPYPTVFLNSRIVCRRLLVAAAILCSLVCLPQAFAQISTVVFSDDFAASTIDTNKYQPDAPFFEGGLGDIHAQAGNGVMQFVGTTTQQWWSGATSKPLRMKCPTAATSSARPSSFRARRMFSTCP